MVVGGKPSPILTNAEIERRRGLLCDFWRWACGWPEGREVGEFDPRYVEVTEGRDPGPGYSSCRDLAHAGLTRVGIRLSFLLRAELGTWAYGRPAQAPGMVPWSGIVEAGDWIIVANDWPRGRDSHVMCVLGVEGDRLLTAEYGKPGGKLCEYPLGDVLGGKRVRVRMPFVEVIREAFHKGLLVDPDWPPKGDTEPSPPPDPTRLVLLGVDVSANQSPASVDWQLLRTLGYSFAIVRGVRMGRELDKTAPEHVERARAARFSVGLYGFFDPRHEASRQFELMVDAHHACDIRPGDIAPVLDIESIEGGPQASREWVTPTVGILDSYRRHWGAAIRYHNVSDWRLMGKPEALEAFPLWLGDYTPPADLPCALWQHTSSVVPGYGKVLDQNVAHADLPRIGHPMEAVTQAPPLFDLRSTPATRWAARDGYIRHEDDE